MAVEREARKLAEAKVMRASTEGEGERARLRGRCEALESEVKKAKKDADRYNIGCTHFLVIVQIQSIYRSCIWRGKTLDAPISW